MVTFDELGCSRSESDIKNLVERTIHRLQTEYGSDPNILLRSVDATVKEVLPNDFDIYDVNCRGIIARRVREYLDNFRGGTLPLQPKTDWQKNGAIVGIVAILVTIIFFVLGEIW